MKGAIGPRRRLACCVSGRGRLAQAVIGAADALGLEPVAMVCDETAAHSLEAFAANAGLAYAKLDAADRPRFDARVVEVCEATAADLVLLTFNKLVPEALISHLPRSIVNVHMSLLPAFKGFSAMKKAVRSGTRVGGATLHLVDAGVDAGPIIAQTLAPIGPDTTPDSLGATLYPQLLAMTMQTLAAFAAGRVRQCADGRVWIDHADYTRLPTVPAVEPAVQAQADRVLASMSDSS